MSKPPKEFISLGGFRIFMALELYIHDDFSTVLAA